MFIKNITYVYCLLDIWNKYVSTYLYNKTVSSKQLLTKKKTIGMTGSKIFF